MSIRRAVFPYLGFVLGAAFGGLGIAVTRFNEQSFGAAYLSYRWSWLAIPSLPGMLIAEGHDWRFDEWWFHRYEIFGWNIFLWGMLWLLIFIVWNARKHFSSAARLW